MPTVRTSGLGVGAVGVVGASGVGVVGVGAAGVGVGVERCGHIRSHSHIATTLWTAPPTRMAITTVQMMLPSSIAMWTVAAATVGPGFTF